MLSEGQMLGRYRLLNPIGSGGMGQVYLAEDSSIISRQVAVKVLQTEFVSNIEASNTRSAISLFQREARAVAVLDHPHILPLYDYGKQNVHGATFFYLVTPYRPEGSLAGWLSQRKGASFSLQDIAQMVNQAASALQYAHDHQIIHQDVKPSNFLVRTDKAHMQLQLTDFGIAKLSTTTSNISQSVRGTPIYMAPEQWAGKPVYASDQYALAIMAYELITGRAPFQGAPMQLMYAHVSTVPQDPSKLRPNLPSAVDTVLRRALAKKHADRFPSISDFSSGFQQALQQTAFSAASPYNSVTVSVSTPGEQNSYDPYATLTVDESEVKRDTPYTLKPSVSTSISPRDTLPSASGFFTDHPAHDKVTPPLSRKWGTAFVGGSLLLLFVLVSIIMAVSSGSILLFGVSTKSKSSSSAVAMPTATVIAPATATALALQNIYNKQPAFQDKLADNTNSWCQYIAQCKYSDGSLHLIDSGATGSSFVTGTPSTANLDFHDFAYQVNMKVLKGFGGGIIFRAGNGQGGNITRFYYFLVGTDGSYSLILRRENDTSPSLTLDNGSSSAIQKGLNQDNLVTVVVHGSIFDLYVNHQKIVSVNDSTYSHGTIGIFAYDDGHPNNEADPPVEVVFSNAKVWTF